MLPAWKNQSFQPAESPAASRADAIAASRQFMVLHCGHEDHPCSAAECLADLIGQHTATAVAEPPQLAVRPGISRRKALTCTLISVEPHEAAAII